MQSDLQEVPRPRLPLGLIDIPKARRYAFRDFQIWSRDLGPLKAAEKVLDVIDQLNLYPLPGEDCPNWRAFLAALVQIASGTRQSHEISSATHVAADSTSAACDPLRNAQGA